MVGPAIAGKMARYEWGDAVMVIYLALDGPVDTGPGRQAGAAAQVHLRRRRSKSLAQASSECRAGGLPEAPSSSAGTTRRSTPAVRRMGRHLKKLVVLGVPYRITGDATGRIAGRHWDDARDAYADYLIDRVAADYLPEARRRSSSSGSLIPRSTSNGNSAAPSTAPSATARMLPYQSGPTRPIPELAHYRTPVPNVYLCGSGSHPGPGRLHGPRSERRRRHSRRPRPSVPLAQHPISHRVARRGPGRAGAGEPAHREMQRPGAVKGPLVLFDGGGALAAILDPLEAADAALLPDPLLPPVDHLPLLRPYRRERIARSRTT